MTRLGGQIDLTGRAQGLRCPSDTLAHQPTKNFNLVSCRAPASRRPAGDEVSPNKPSSHRERKSTESGRLSIRGEGRRFAIAGRAALCLVLLIPSIPDLGSKAEFRGLITKLGHTKSHHPDRLRGRVLSSQGAHRGLRLRAVVSRGPNHPASPQDGVCSYLRLIVADARPGPNEVLHCPPLVMTPLRC